MAKLTEKAKRVAKQSREKQGYITLMKLLH